MQAAMSASLLNLGARKAFVALCARLRALLGDGAAAQPTRSARCSAPRSRSSTPSSASASRCRQAARPRRASSPSSTLIERNYVQYLGLTQALRLSQPAFMEQFRRMLVSKLRVVFENASGEIELWNKATSAQVESQLRERRRSFRRRRESLERIQAAAGELEQRIAEVESQDERAAAAARARRASCSRRCASRPAPAPAGIEPRR